MLAELAASANEEHRVAAAKANMDPITELMKLEEEELLTESSSPCLLRSDDTDASWTALRVDAYGGGRHGGRISTQRFVYHAGR